MAASRRAAMLLGAAGPVKQAGRPSRYNPPMARSIARRLLDWYAAHGRKLPWRGRRDPYAIWVSEIMLQQTRVEVVAGYFARWMRRFPTLADLAAADLEQVLAVWEGLGYYGRARNLHRAAGRIVAEHGGRLPTAVEALERLPGIGPYSAAAIAALAFGRAALALDGNQMRVLTRLFDLAVDPRTAAGRRLLERRGMALLPRGRAGDFNQALMDLGATVCRARAPDCSRCPLRRDCLARARGTIALRPLRRPRAAVPHRQVAAAVIVRAGRVLIGRRPEGKLLGGLWQFPGGKREPGESLQACLRREVREELAVDVQPDQRLGVFEHAYSHFTVQVVAFGCRLLRGRPRAREHTQLRWVRPRDLSHYPMGKVDRAMARLLAAGAPVSSAAPGSGRARAARSRRARRDSAD